MRRSSLVTRRSLRLVDSLSRRSLRAVGSQGRDYEMWRRAVAIPYLRSRFPYTCARGCGETALLDVGHKLARSTHPQLKLALSNIEWQCRGFNRFGACNYKKESYV